MHVVSGIPKLPSIGLDPDEFKTKAKALLNGVTPKQIRHLLDLAGECTRAGHGAVVVVSSSATEEAERLRHRSTLLRQPIRVREGMIATLTAIDGAVLMDLDARCYAIGAILDGEAEDGQGNPSRGARYNAALTYAKSKSCLVILVSQDGDVSILP
jgi:DNA integrity scanning protein DisA with diadenylate cyclase activity